LANNGHSWNRQYQPVAALPDRECPAVIQPHASRSALITSLSSAAMEKDDYRLPSTTQVYYQ
jgi:hypothetical protein